MKVDFLLFYSNLQIFELHFSDFSYCKDNIAYKRFDKEFLSG